MIGYLNWARLLTETKNDQTFKAKMKGPWYKAKKAAMDKKIIHKQAEPDDQDELIWRVRYVKSIATSLSVAEQLFFELGAPENIESSVGLLACPNDCIDRLRLNIIGDIIDSEPRGLTTPPLKEGDIISSIAIKLVMWGIKTKPPLTVRQTDQFAKIILHLGQSNMALDIPTETSPAGALMRSC